jgi:hypothetical protein
LQRQLREQQALIGIRLAVAAQGELSVIGGGQMHIPI